MSRLVAHYRVRSDARSIEARAGALALEQSVELPLDAIDDPKVRADIVGRVESVEDAGDGTFRVRIGLAAATTGLEAGQLMNMLFGNSSIQDDVMLEDAEFPPELTAAFGGARQGMDGLRRRCGAEGRAMTCSALKPQGFAPARLAELARRMAEGGIDVVKDDHGLADQDYSPFAARVPACARAVRASGGHARYAPSLSGDLDSLRAQVRLARDEGLDTALIAPLIVGLPAFHTLVREFPDIAWIAHPAMAGAARVSPPFLLGKLFRLLGADATIFPNHGGRFGYSPETCLEIAETARAPWQGIRPCVPVPAGGMRLDRVAEMLDFYGRDVMLLIGGDLLAARERLGEAAAAFATEVAGHRYG